MESYLVDKEVLGEVVDALISEKCPGQPAVAYAGIREEAIKALDHQILRDILGKLTKEQGQELSHLLDENDSDPKVFEDFFAKNGIDLAETVKDTMVHFKNEFLKGGRDA